VSLSPTMERAFRAVISRTIVMQPRQMKEMDQKRPSDRISFGSAGESAVIVRIISRPKRPLPMPVRPPHTTPST